MMLDDIVSRGRGGPPGQFHDNSNGGQNGTVQEIMIPAGKAGLVIGKGGETIKQLQVREWRQKVPSIPRKFPCCIWSAHHRHPQLLSQSSILFDHGPCPKCTSCRRLFESPTLTVDIGFKGTCWSKDDFNSRWFPEYKC